MFYNKELTIMYLNHRIHMLLAHGEEKNKNLINALIRQKRNLENE